MVTKLLYRYIQATLLFFFMLSYQTVVFATSPAHARQLAETFAQKRNPGVTICSGDIRQLSLEEPGLRTAGDNPYYIFNIGEDKGFVLLSGSSSQPVVLGYSDEGTFDLHNMPSNLRAVLNNYAENIRQAALTASAYDLSATEELSGAQLNATTVVAPLLGGTKWNQTAPYNNLCPVSNAQHALVGCVAIALGQIMRYHQWPVTGTGTHSYTHATFGTLSANFGQTTYDWNNMLDAYSSSATDAQNLAAATLLYQTGVAVDMNYSLTNSTSTIDKAAHALVSYFGFDPDLQAYDRVFFTNKEWLNLIKSELNQLRPMYYSGVTTSGEGHAFVCDGYDSQDFFHINWGWGGLGNGYFDLKSLSYQYPGTAGATGGFSMNQSVIVSMKKNDQISNPSYCMRLNGYDFTTSAASIANKNTGTFASTFAAYNLGANSFTGKLGVGYRQANGPVTLLKTFSSGSSTTLTIGSYSNYPYLLNINSISLKDLAAGSYTILPVYQPSDSTGWSAFRGLPERICSLTATVNANGSVSIVSNKNIPALSMNQPLTAGSSLYAGKKTTVDFTVTNTGKEFSSYMGLALYSSSNTYLGMLTQDFFTCPEGESQTYHVVPTLGVPAGNYYLAVVADSTNSGSYSAYKTLPGSNPVAIQVLPAPGPSSLSLRQQIQLAGGTVVKRNEDLTVQADLTNSGGLFNNQLIVFVFPASGGSSLTSFSPVTTLIDSLQNKTVELKGQLTLDDGDYKLSLYQNNGSSWTNIGPSGSNTLSFTVSGSANPVSTTEIPVLFSISNRRLSLNQNLEYEGIQVVDLMGRIRRIPVNQMQIDFENMPEGVYLLRVKTDGKIRSEKFIVP